MPHVHVHIVPRYLTDPAPGQHLSDGAWALPARSPRNCCASRFLPSYANSGLTRRRLAVHLPA